MAFPSLARKRPAHRVASGEGPARSRVGWRFVAPFQMVDGGSEVANLADTSPAMVAHRLRTA